MVHGVPVQAFIDSRRNALYLGGVPQKDPAALRVFVQCMELKSKGPEDVGLENCKEIAARGNMNSKVLLDRGATY